MERELQNLTKAIEAILFAANEPQKIEKLAKLLKVKTEDIFPALDELEKSLEDRGIKLLRKDGSVALGSSPEFSSLVQNFFKEEVESKLTKASLEALTIVTYQGPISRSKIEHIRGVNSLYTLRNLLIRGLVERIPNPNSPRTFLYQTSFDLMRLLGITKREELPHFEKVNKELNEFLVQESQNKEEAP